ncbi:MAG TPA: RedB protein [Blastocatellia bacterium]|nr:RedB protein [Blastocatellia bacterium]
MRLQNTRLVSIALSLCWLGLVGVGLKIIWRYEQTPGTSAAPPASWPAESRVERAAGRPTLIMLAHPQCPCTRASIGELNRLMAQNQGRLEARVLFYHPPDFSSEWVESDLWRSAAAIPGVTVAHDPNGVEARRFHAATSGQVLLYDAGGRLLFEGGITASRGHHGDNLGSRSITSLLLGGAAEATRTPVFGCSLFASDGADREETQSCRP